MAKERVDIFIRAKDFASRVFSRLGRAGKRVDRVFKAMRKTFRTVAFGIGAVTGAAVGAVLALGKLATKGGEIVNVQRAFERATGDSAAALKFLREQTFGLIDDYELMKNLNQAVTLGSAKTTEQFAELAKTAIALGRALGIDAQFALESLNTGIARQSRLFLDNIGIILSVGDANKQYAASIGKTVKQLTDADKREAFRTAALIKAREAIARLGGVQLTAADRVTQAGVAIKNFTIKLAAMVAQSPFVGELFGKIGSFATDIATILGGSKQDIVDTLKDLGGAGGNAFVVAFLKALQALGPVVRNALSKIFIDPKAVETLNRLTGAGERPAGGPGDTRLLTDRFLAERGIVAPEPTDTRIFSEAIANAQENLEAFSDSLAERAARLRAGKPEGPGFRRGEVPGGAPTLLLPGLGGVPRGIAPIGFDEPRMGVQRERSRVLLDQIQPLVAAQREWATLIQGQIPPFKRLVSLQGFAKDVIESTLTPQEEYTKLVDRLNEAYGLGLLSAQQYERGIQAASDALEGGAGAVEDAVAQMINAFGGLAEQMISRNKRSNELLAQAVLSEGAAQELAAAGLLAQAESQRLIAERLRAEAESAKRGFLSDLLGTAGGLLSLAPNPLTMGGRLLAGGIGAGFGILSSLARPSRDPVPVNINDISDRAVEKQRRSGPDRIVIQILDAQGRPIREIERDLRDLTRRDGIQRLPRGFVFGDT